MRKMPEMKEEEEEEEGEGGKRMAELVIDSRVSWVLFLSTAPV